MYRYDPRIHGARDGAPLRGIVPRRLTAAGLLALLAVAWPVGPAPAGAQEALPPEPEAVVEAPTEVPAPVAEPAPEAAPAAIAAPEPEASTTTAEPVPEGPETPPAAVAAPEAPSATEAPATAAEPSPETPAPAIAAPGPSPEAAPAGPTSTEGTEGTAEAAPANTPAPAPKKAKAAPNSAPAPPAVPEPPRPRVNWSKVKNPVAANAASIQRGRELYNGIGLCSVCHGDKGDGFGPVRGQFSPFPNAFFDPAWHRSMGDGQIMGVLQEGKFGTAMVRIVPDFLTEAQGWDVVNYLRTFQGKTTESYERYQAFLRDNPNGAPPDIGISGAEGAEGGAEGTEGASDAAAQP